MGWHNDRKSCRTVQLIKQKNYGARPRLVVVSLPDGVVLTAFLKFHALDRTWPGTGTAMEYGVSQGLPQNTN